MKVVILAGGLGTRLAEETEIKPKPMVEIGNWPVLWHIMKIYAHFGYSEFIVALGYKGEHIKRYFRDYRILNSSLKISLGTGEVEMVDAVTLSGTPDRVAEKLEAFEHVVDAIKLSGPTHLIGMDVTREAQLAILRDVPSPDFKLATVHARFPVSAGTAGLEAALQELCAASELAVDEGYEAQRKRSALRLL